MGKSPRRLHRRVRCPPLLRDNEDGRADVPNPSLTTSCPIRSPSSVLSFWSVAASQSLLSSLTPTESRRRTRMRPSHQNPGRHSTWLLERHVAGGALSTH